MTVGPAVGWAVLLVIFFAGFYVVLAPRLVSGGFNVYLPLDESLAIGHRRIYGVGFHTYTQQTRHWPGRARPHLPIQTLSISLNNVWVVGIEPTFRGTDVEVDPVDLQARAWPGSYDFTRVEGVAAWLRAEYGLDPEEAKFRELASVIHAAALAAKREGVVLDQQHQLQWPKTLAPHAARAGASFDLPDGGIYTIENDDELIGSLVFLIGFMSWGVFVFVAWRRTA